MTDIKLPTKKIKAAQQSPKNLIIFSKPKVGKSALLAGLNNCLLIDTEDGSDYIDAMKVKASSWEDIQKIGKAIRESDHKYDYIAVDTTMTSPKIMHNMHRGYNNIDNEQQINYNNDIQINTDDFVE